jgi:lysophospholipase L1-like esterase
LLVLVVVGTGLIGITPQGPPATATVLGLTATPAARVLPVSGEQRVPVASPGATGVPVIRDALRVREGGLRPAVSVPAPAPESVPRLSTGSTAVFLGDSYTSGWNGAGIGSRGWPEIVARDQGWTGHNLAVAGTGFVNPGWTAQPVGSRVAAAIRLRPDVVVIAAGHNDSRWSVSETARAADRVIDRLHEALPDAILVVVAPIWANGNPPSRCLDLRDRLRRKARSIDAIFIDPLGDRWFAGSDHRFIGSDGIHPTNAGHRYLARQVLAAFD